MSRRKTFNTPGHAHFLTFSCWQRQPFLLDHEACLIFLQSLAEARARERFTVWAYVLMPEHVHLLIRPLSEIYQMATILRRIKEPVSWHVLAAWRRDHPGRLAAATDTTAAPVGHRFWQPGGGFDRNLYSPDIIRHTIAYIEGNPVRRRLVSSPLEWEWSSARARSEHAAVPFKVDELTM
ncbi:MAG TPA: hypothetical protein VM118_04895 [Acidobacteriota bacterium]|nr:hypothetical protein [Acidobacteriota bacterium]